jgi:hypothetical protein
VNAPADRNDLIPKATDLIPQPGEHNILAIYRRSADTFDGVAVHWPNLLLFVARQVVQGMEREKTDPTLRQRREAASRLVWLSLRENQVPPGDCFLVGVVMLSILCAYNGGGIPADVREQFKNAIEKKHHENIEMAFYRERDIPATEMEVYRSLPAVQLQKGERTLTISWGDIMEIYDVRSSCLQEELMASVDHLARMFVLFFERMPDAVYVATQAARFTIGMSIAMAIESMEQDEIKEQSVN